MLERPLALALSVRGGDVPAAAQLVLVDHQAVQAHGPAGVDLVGADADLGAEAVAHAVGHAGGGVPEDAGRVDGGHEALGQRGGRCEDRVGVVRPVEVDVRDGGGGVRDGLDGEDE
jgi:hypothetical protein